jgi:hypothetical protein
MAKNDKKETNFIKVVKEDGSLGFVLGTAWIGALVYFVQQSEGFGGFIVAVLQAIVWPAYVLHAVLGNLGI